MDVDVLFGSLLGMVILLSILGRLFPTVGHTIFGWRKITKPTHFEGGGEYGYCDICQKNCLKDTHGEWF